MNFPEEHINIIMKHYSSDIYETELSEAKEEFHVKTGMSFQVEEKFNETMNAFVDWYVFDRPLKNENLAPVKLHLKKIEENSESTEFSAYQGLAQSVPSLFELRAIKKKGIHMKDLCDSESYKVLPIPACEHFLRGDIIQTRVIPVGDAVYFGQSFIFHPLIAKKYLKKQIKKIRSLSYSDRVEWMLRLASMKMKTERYTHVSEEKIYSEDPVV